MRKSADVQDVPDDIVVESAQAALRAVKLLTRSGWWLFTIGSVVLPSAAILLLALGRTPEVVVAKPGHDLVSYQQIRGDDVQIKKMATHPGVARTLESVIGRVVLRPIKAGEAVDTASLTTSRMNAGWNQTDTISVQIKPVPNGAFTTLPQKITLRAVPKAGVSKSPPDSGWEAILLKIDQSKDSWATITLSNADTKALGQALSTSDLYIVHERSSASRP